MKKIIVIGCPGSGKSVFSRRLSEATQSPLYHLDLLFWKADGTNVAKDIFLKSLRDILEEDCWIIDGNYASTMEERLRAADTVFFLDYPLEVCLDGIMERRGKERPDMPWVEPVDHIDEDFLDLIKNYETSNRPEVIALLKKYQNKKIYIFNSRQEADRFIAQR